MRTITKEAEPPCLAQARRDAGAPISSKDWDDCMPVGGKQEIREALLAEQFGLCVYCGNRIKPFPPTSSNPGGMTVEHWVAREEDTSKTFEWSNLFGVCSGGVFDAGGPLHCDKKRLSEELQVHPCTVGLEQRFKYSKSTGEVTPARDSDVPIQSDIETLGLNTSRLMAGRKEVILKVQRALRRDDSTGNCRRLWQNHSPSPGASLPSYSFVVRQYLRPKMKQRNIPVSE